MLRSAYQVRLFPVSSWPVLRKAISMDEVGGLALLRNDIAVAVLGDVRISIEGYKQVWEPRVRRPGVWLPDDVPRSSDYGGFGVAEALGQVVDAAVLGQVVEAGHVLWLPLRRVRDSGKSSGSFVLVVIADLFGLAVRVPVSEFVAFLPLPSVITAVARCHVRVGNHPSLPHHGGRTKCRRRHMGGPEVGRNRISILGAAALILLVFPLRGVFGCPTWRGEELTVFLSVSTTVLTSFEGFWGRPCLGE